MVSHHKKMLIDVVQGWSGQYGAHQCTKNVWYETETFILYLSFETPEVLAPDLLDFKYELRCFSCCDIFQNSLCKPRAMFVFRWWRAGPGVEEYFRLASSVFQSKRKTTNMADTDKSVKIEEGDPQSVQDLTGFVPFDIQHIILPFHFMLELLCCWFFLETGL